VPLCPIQIPHDLNRAPIQVSAVEGRQLTTWAMARLLPSFIQMYVVTPKQIKTASFQILTNWLYYQNLKLHSIIYW
jgi:hypothetical protein